MKRERVNERRAENKRKYKRRVKQSMKKRVEQLMRTPPNKQGGARSDQLRLREQLAWRAGKN